VNHIDDDAYSVQVFDGLGQVFEAASYHPGSDGGYSAVTFAYDKMGRVVKRSNPTEINGNWQPTGIDNAGWVSTTQTYDWKGRPLVTTHLDGWQQSASYGGCGCAGGEVTTVTDEAGRRKRTTADVLGRMTKAEQLNWDGSVYSTANYVYTALDQISSIDYEGQTRSFAYDGYGRLQTRTTPEQGATNYYYNSDDTTNYSTDARGVTSTFSYNGRHQVRAISFSIPSGVAATPNVTIDYDGAGNRTSMTDSNGGAVSYVYDSLSRVTSETRTLPVGSFSLSYNYNYASELTSITNPWSASVGYDYDNSGRLLNISGAGYPGVTSYASNINYRAFGAIKSMSFGDQQTLSNSYDNRMRPTSSNVSNVLGYNYNYYEHTSRVNYAQSTYDSKLDRSWEYDQVAALVFARSGSEARAAWGLGPWGNSDGPYAHVYDYDKFGNMTRRFGWGGEVQGGAPYGGDTDIQHTYTKNQRDGFGYDLAGNLTNDLTQTYTYDGMGQQATATASGYFLSQGYDGDGLRNSKVENGAVTYYLRSSVLGGAAVAEIDGNGGWSRGYVYAGSDLLAVQQNGVYWSHEDDVTKSKRITDSNGNVVSTIELDPWGANTNRSTNSAFMPQNFTSYIRDANGGQDAMARRYSIGGTFSQPDPYGGSYDFSDPQSLNRYAYTKNDPVNFRDPSGLTYEVCGAEFGGAACIGEGFWGGGFNFNRRVSPTGSSGQQIIRNAEPRVAIFTFDMDENILGVTVESSMFYDPQNVAPITVRYMNQKYVKDFQKVLNDAQKRLQKPDCAKLFGKSAADLISILENTEYRVLPLASGGPKYDPSTGKVSVEGAQTNSPTSVFINSKGPFFNNQMFVPGKSGLQVLDFGSGLRGTQFGALLLLHELGHQTGIFGSDAGNYNLNRQYTRQVQNACF
jgi:RHS repeat-associated protein